MSSNWAVNCSFVKFNSFKVSFNVCNSLSFALILLFFNSFISLFNSFIFSLRIILSLVNLFISSSFNLFFDWIDSFIVIESFIIFSFDLSSLFNNSICVSYEDIFSAISISFLFLILLICSLLSAKSLFKKLKFLFNSVFSWINWFILFFASSNFLLWSWTNFVLFSMFAFFSKDKFLFKFSISFFNSLIWFSYSFIFFVSFSLLISLFICSFDVLIFLVNFWFNSEFSFLVSFKSLFKSFNFLFKSFILSKYFLSLWLFSSYLLFIKNAFVSFNLFKQKISVLSTLDISSSPINSIFFFNCFIFFISSSILFTLNKISFCISFIFELFNCISWTSVNISFFLLMKIVFISSVIDDILFSILFFSSFNNFIFISFWEIFVELFDFSFNKLSFSSFKKLILFSILFSTKFIEFLFNKLLFSKGIIFFSSISICWFKEFISFLYSSSVFLPRISCS